MDLSEPASATLQIHNLGGIVDLETSLRPGVTILSGENATNRTSLLRSIAAALGAEAAAATLKTDTEEGSVSLSIGGETATREYTKSNGTVIRNGNPLSDRPELVDTYAALFATNPARSAIREGGEGLRDILMRGIDTTAIKSKIQSLKQERASLENELKQIEAAQKDLPSLRENENSLEEELATITEDIDAVQTEIDEYEATSEEIEQAEEHLEQLEDLREQLRRKETEIEHSKESIKTLEDEQAEIEASLQSLSGVDQDRDELAAEKRSLEDEISALQNTIAQLNDVVSNNKAVLDGSDVLGEFGLDDVAEQLNPDQASVQCWTCGSEVERAQIQERIDTLTDIRQEKNNQVQELREQRDEIEDTIAEIKQQERKRRELESKLKETQQTIESEQTKLEELRDEVETIQSQIEDVEARVDETEELRDSDLPDAYQRLSQLQHDRGRVETKLESVREEIASKQDRIDKKDGVESQLADVRSELEDARGRIERTEKEVIEQFNDQMEDLIDLLGYENIARVWLERLVGNGTQSSEFEIHVVRDSEDGTAYEDTLDTLSESEREIIGIVIALSGYLVHDLDKTVPIVLFDSVEAIDANRLEKLFEYINDYSPFIVAALLPEDASAIDKPTVEAPAFEGAKP